VCVCVSVYECRRTLDPAEASAFFIPYDLGFDAAVKKDSAKIRPHGCPNAEAVIALLEDSPFFRRNHGYDHFLVQGLNQAMGNFNERSVLRSYTCYETSPCVDLTCTGEPRCYSRQ